jgi:hypothetical protein
MHRKHGGFPRQAELVPIGQNRDILLGEAALIQIPEPPHGLTSAQKLFQDA